ncbi:replicative DNA helicase [Xanthomonas phage vB_XciM_LucasX]|nr:replicative DNA helicase [Xanthomonas phage vB_XciM_LucasX]
MSATSDTIAPSSGFTADDIIKAMNERPPRLQLDVYSHGVRASHFGAEIRAFFIDLCRTEWADFSMVRVGRFKFARKISRVFVGTNRDRSVFHFHRNQLDFVLARLRKQNIFEDRILIVRHELYTPAKVTHKVNDTRPPREEQLPMIEYIHAPCDPRYAPSKVVTLQTGKGKAQPLDARIRVPGSWSTMGEMKVGSKVIAKDGSIVQVTGVYPQGLKEIFRVTFADGRSTECCAEHLWKVFYINTVPHRRWRIVDTKEMIRLLAMPNPRVYIDLPDAETQPDVELPMNPYILGAILGDGHIGLKMLSFSSKDEFLIEQLREALPEGLSLKHLGRYDYRIIGERGKTNAWIRIMRDLELDGCLSFNKAIPEDYMNGSHNQRLALVQGLLDTDGTVGRDTGTVQFCTTSPFLAMQFQYLIRSLGGIASLGTRNPSYFHNGERRLGRQAFVITVRHKEPSSLFRLPRKVELCKDDGQYVSGLKLRVMSVESIGEKEAQCISVDHPDHLYVTDDFIVTHNTFLSLYSMRQFETRIAIILKGMYIDKWIPDVEGAYGAEKGSLMVIRGIPQLRAAIEMVKHGKFSPRVVIISNKTMFMYLQYYEKFGVDEYLSVAPMDLYKYFGIGIRLIDEVHQEFHCNFRQDLYTHIPLTLSLSATLDPDSPFKDQMYKICWPVGTWAPELAHDCYIAVKALWYRFRNLDGIKWINPMRQYSHGEFEKSILKKPQVLANYVEMITDIVQTGFMSVREPGQKMIIFVASIQLATILTTQLKSLYPKLLINRYVEDDEYEDLVAADISVSTLLSAGTAVDIPNLRVTLMTTALSDKQANLQVLGRTRKLVDWPDVTPDFLFLVAKDIDKQVGYAQDKRVKFEGKVKSFQDLRTNYVV